MRVCVCACIINDGPANTEWPGTACLRLPAAESPRPRSTELGAYTCSPRLRPRCQLCGEILPAHQRLTTDSKPEARRFRASYTEAICTREYVGLRARVCAGCGIQTVLTTRARVEFPAQRVGPEQAVLRERRQGLAASPPHQLKLHINPIHPLCRPPARSGRVGIGSLCAALRVRVTARLLVCMRSRAGAQRT
jgi:hypothetical protein